MVLSGTRKENIKLVFLRSLDKSCRGYPTLLCSFVYQMDRNSFLCLRFTPATGVDCLYLLPTSSNAAATMSVCYSTYYIFVALTVDLINKDKMSTEQKLRG